MRTSTFVNLLAAVGLAGGGLVACADTRPAPMQPEPQPPPEFESAAAPEPTETPASTERQEPIAPEDQVLFAFDSAELAPGATSVLDDAVAWVQGDPTRTILIRGHADPIGAAEYNLDLSARRAETVAAYLEMKGVSRRQISITAVGEQAAVVEPAGGNRRVIIFGMTADPANAAASR